MALGWGTRRVLITVRTYPVPATKGIEVSCTAGITVDGTWIRIFPVPYRHLKKDKRFKKYQWIEVSLKRATKDPRTESHHLNIETIKLKDIVPSTNGWAARTELLAPLIRPSLCAIKKVRDEKGSPTLGLFRPKEIKRLVIEKDSDDWSPKQKAILSQKSFGFEEEVPKQDLEKIPYSFSYEFVCSDQNCSGHKLGCTDWEMAEAYRRWHKDYGAKWEQKFRQRFEQDMKEKFDTHFYVGTLHQHPNNWMIVGLFYPPKKAMEDLFN